MDGFGDSSSRMMGGGGNEIEECHQLLGESETELGDDCSDQMLEMETDSFVNNALDTEEKEDDRRIIADCSSDKPWIGDATSFVATGITTEGSGDTYSSGDGGNKDSSSCGSNQGVSDGVLSEMALDDENSCDIEEDVSSRQLVVYGRETIQKMFASNILVSGMQGLGAEIAKNLVLTGVKSVTLHDEGFVELWDLSSSFVFTEEDLGKNRALASVQKLQELNNSVIISTITSVLTKECLSDFQAVVFTDISLDKAVEYNDYCHAHQPPIAFIKSEVRGLFGSVFCDFGPQFTLVDVDGEKPHTGIIASVSNDNPALVSYVDDKGLEFQDGDLVVFSEVHGMTELNDGKPRKVRSGGPFSFFIEEDTTKFSPHIKDGIITQVKQPRVLNFKTLRESLRDPGDYLLSDFSKFDRPPLLHVAFQALDRFRTELGRFPVAGSEEDAQKFIFLVIKINDSLEEGYIGEIDQDVVRSFAFGARAVLSPMAAIFGCLVGQEVVKACSGNFHPLFQFFYFDSFESLPKEPLDANDSRPLNSRYDAQISVFGAKLQKKMEEAKVFMVGSGALGCEFLKNFALMGIACSDKGKLTVADDDIIEKNNLSRQFLFHDWNISQAKSTVAATAAALINPRLNVEALQSRASPETENVFDDSFWENLTVVVDALDNVNDRLYIDQRCFHFQKPLLESRTLGAKCNMQMVIPRLTEYYGASRDPPEKQAARCTVHSFPHNIDHCLTWARSEFEGLLEKIPTEVNAYLSSPSEYSAATKNAGDAQARHMLERVIECLDKDKCEIFEDCVTWARLKFEDYFANRVKRLTCTFPKDATTSTGAPFWSPPYRFPRPLQFSVDDPSHLHFVMAASILRAETFGIPIPDWVKSQSKLADAFNNVIFPDFHPKKDAKVDSDEKATSISASSIDDSPAIDLLILRLEDCRTKLSPGFKMKPIQFEKDDDTNDHMDFIAGLANMRARNYSIPEIDKLRAKFIVKIPAIATSTTMATGLVCLELYKVLDGAHACSDSGTISGTSEEINHASQITTGADSGTSKEINHTSQSTTGADSGTSEEINHTSQSTMGADSETSEEVNNTSQSTTGADSGTSEQINHTSRRTTGADSETSEEINHNTQSTTGAESETSEEINHTSLSTTGADSETSEEINHISQSTTGAGDHDHTDDVSSPSVLSTCSQSISHGVGSAANLENEVIISESGNKDNETNLNGNLEAPEVETSLSLDEDEDVSLIAMKSEVHRRPFLYLIKVPRFEEDDKREQIKIAQHELHEKTKFRDSYKVLIQTKKAVCQELSDDLEAAKLEEKVARDNLKAKRREIDVAQVVIDKVNNAMTVEDIAGSIRHMEHIIQHEPVSLSEEKQLMREIKRLKHFREQLSSSIGTQEELQEALDQKDQIRDQLKSLKKELDPIRSHVQKAETATKVAKKKCFDEFAELNKLYLEFRAADAVRQEAFMSLVSLRRELAQKNKVFRMYKDNEKAAKDYALSGDKEALHSLCVNQVDIVMELWNRNDEFRREYVKCNARSTLRRLKTLDGRSPALDEEALSLPYVRNDRFIQSLVVTSQFPSLEQSKIQAPYIAEQVNEEPVVECVEKEVRGVSNVSSEEQTLEAKKEVKKTKEEEELAKKEEKMRKKEEEAKMIEQLRLEEKAKAKEALERKKRMAERAQVRAQLRAKREAELREKEREKKLRRKEKRKSPEGGKEAVNENDFMAAPERRAELHNATGVSKRHHKPSHYPKVTKTNTMPLPLRNRARRRMQLWMWIGVSSLAAVAMVLIAFSYLSSLAEQQQIRN